MIYRRAGAVRVAGRGTHQDGDEAAREEHREQGEVLEGAGRETRLEPQHGVVDRGHEL